jgi:hypothetical protein
MEANSSRKAMQEMGEEPVHRFAGELLARVKERHKTKGHGK